MAVDKITEPAPAPPLARGKALASGEINGTGYSQGKVSDFRKGWRYYELGTMEALITQEVPYLSAPFTVQREEVEIFLVTSQYLGQPRNLQGARYLGDMITLEQRKAAQHVGRLGLIRFANRLYLGVAE